MGVIYRRMQPRDRAKVREAYRRDYDLEVALYDKKIAALGNEDTLAGEQATHDLMEAAANSRIETAGKILRTHGSKIYSIDLLQANAVAVAAENTVISNKILFFLEDAIREQVAGHIISGHKFRLGR